MVPRCLLAVRVAVEPPWGYSRRELVREYLVTGKTKRREIPDGANFTAKRPRATSNGFAAVPCLGLSNRLGRRRAETRPSFVAHHTGKPERRQTRRAERPPLLPVLVVASRVGVGGKGPLTKLRNSGMQFYCD